MRPFRGSLGFWTALFAVTWLCALDAAPAGGDDALGTIIALLIIVILVIVILRLLDKKVVIK